MEDQQTNFASPEQAEEDEAKNITWESNHQKIIAVINKTMEYYRKSPPTITEISNATGLTRKTIYSHLKEYRKHAAYKQRFEMLGLMEFDVLMGICSHAISGNTKAAKLYLELRGLMPQKAGQSQNITGDTNIQINGLVFNQEVLQNLNPEQMKMIEEIIRPVAKTAPILLQNEQEHE